MDDRKAKAAEAAERKRLIEEIGQMPEASLELKAIALVLLQLDRLEEKLDAMRRGQFAARGRGRGG